MGRYNDILWKTNNEYVTSDLSTLIKPRAIRFLK